MQWAIQAGLTLTCYWFNQPPEDGEENSVTVYKWDCAPGTESGRELEYYQGVPDQETGPCETQHTNIPISLIDGDGEHPTTTQADGTEWDGVVLDPEGGFQIVERFQRATAIRWSSAAPSTTKRSSRSRRPVVNNHAPQSSRSPTSATGTTSPSLTTTTSTSTSTSPDALPDQDKTYYEGELRVCRGLGFNVQWTDGGSTETTDASGHASWSGVPVGEWQGTETVPEGYGEPYIWCRYLEWPDEATVDGGLAGTGCSRRRLTATSNSKACASSATRTTSAHQRSGRRARRQLDHDLQVPLRAGN